MSIGSHLLYAICLTCSGYPVHALDETWDSLAWKLSVFPLKGRTLEITRFLRGTTAIGMHVGSAAQVGVSLP